MEDVITEEFLERLFFNQFNNEEGIERNPYYQEDQSNFAEARDLLKQLDKVENSIDRYGQILERSDTPILDCITPKGSIPLSYDQVHSYTDDRKNKPKLNMISHNEKSKQDESSNEEIYDLSKQLSSDMIKLIQDKSP